MHLGKKTLNHDYTVPSLELGVIMQYIDLGVMIDCSLKSMLRVQQQQKSHQHIWGYLQ